MYLPIGSFSYLLEQNAGIANGTVSGTPINLKFLGVGDGLTVRSFPDMLAMFPHLEYVGSPLAVPRLHLVRGFEPVPRPRLLVYHQCSQHILDPVRWLQGPDYGLLQHWRHNQMLQRAGLL